MRVFADAGIYIDYLQGKDVRLKILNTFEKLLEKGKFKLIFPLITKEELYRGFPIDRMRYSKNKFSKLSMPSVPAEVKDEDEYREAEKLLEEYSSKIELVRKKSEKTIDDLMRNHIEKLMEKSEKEIIEDQSILEAASIRKLKGNPPGKSTDPLGDEIVWELLLEKCTDEDLIIISHDGDWRYDDWKQNELAPFLKREWVNKSNKNINLFRTLTAFIEFIEPSKLTKKDIKLDKEQATSLIYDNNAINIPPNYISVGTPPLTTTTTWTSSMISNASTSTIGTWQPVTFGSQATVVCSNCGTSNVINYPNTSLTNLYICTRCSRILPQ